MRRLAALVLVLMAAAFTACDNEVSLEGDDLPPKGVDLSDLAPMPEPRTEVAGAVWDGRVVVVGGLTAGGRPSARVDVYDPDADRWSPLPDLPRPLHHTAVVTLGGRVWVVGGYTEVEGDAWVPVRMVSSFGAGEDAWRAEPEMEEIRGALAAAVVGESIVAAGGHDGEQVLATTEVLAAGAAAWEPGPPLRTAREHFAMTVAGGDLYAVAGRAPANLDSVEVLRTGAAAWEPGPPVEHSRSGIGAATVTGRPCVAGGEEPGDTIAPVECLAGDGWEVVGELPTPRHGLVVVALGAALHVVGGGPEPGLTVSGAHEVVRIPRG